ncbi:hypothetical protein Tco_1318384 [Tanacetum coccineum]
MEAGTTTTNLTVRLPILNPADYDLWLMMIKQYFLMTDYSLWEVIKNGNKVLKRTVGKVEHEYEPTTTEEKQDRRNEMKARATLLMALPNKDQPKFPLIIKMQIANGSYREDRINNHKSKKHKIVAFVSNSTNSTNNTNKADNTAYEVSTAHTQGNGVNSTSLDNLCDAVICAFLASQPNSPQLAQEDLEQLHPDDLEENGINNGRWPLMRNNQIKSQRVVLTSQKYDAYNLETPTQNALIAQDRIGGYDWSYQAEEEQPTNYALMAFTSSGCSSISDS